MGEQWTLLTESNDSEVLKKCRLSPWKQRTERSIEPNSNIYCHLVPTDSQKDIWYSRWSRTRKTINLSLYCNITVTLLTRVPSCVVPTSAIVLLRPNQSCGAGHWCRKIPCGKRRAIWSPSSTRLLVSDIKPVTTCLSNKHAGKV